MLSRNVGLRSVRVLRNAPRSTFRRPYSAPTDSGLKGAADNAFNRERAAVKAHAAQTTGESVAAPKQAYRTQLTHRLQDSGENYPSSTSFISRSSLSELVLTPDCSAVIPALLIASANAYVLWNEHWEHWNHMPPLEERTEYPYQNLRKKNYPWGNGDKVSHLSVPMALRSLLHADTVLERLGQLPQAGRVMGLQDRHPPSAVRCDHLMLGP